MGKTLWYISKYFIAKTENSHGGRGWALMKTLADEGYKPVVITTDYINLEEQPVRECPVTFEENDGVSLVFLRTIRYKVAKSIPRVMSWFHFEWNLFLLDKSSLPKPDAIVVSSPSLLTVINGILLKRKYGCRFFFEVRDIWPLTIIEEGGFSENNPFVIFLSLIERLGYRESDAIIGTMPNLSAHIKSVIKEDKPVFCVPRIVSEDYFADSQPLDSAYIKKYLSSNKVKVVHAGTIGTTNALDVFFKAAVTLKDNQHIEFILVGEGPLKEHYMELYGDYANIVFAPVVNKNQVQSVLTHCDIAYFSVFPSKVWEYGQSLNKLVDYMLAGIPVVASYSGYPSMINEANSGSFVPAGDVAALVNELLRYSRMTEEERRTNGERGRQWILENRSSNKLAREYANIIFGHI